jgi:hypothetical protein
MDMTGDATLSVTSPNSTPPTRPDDKEKPMSEESDYRDLKRDQADREKQRNDLAAASARREELIAMRTAGITAIRRDLAEQEAKLAEDRRQLELDAETIRIVEAYHANRVRTAEALSGEPFRRAAYDALNDLRLEHIRLNADAGVRVSDAQKGDSWNALYESWAEYVTHNAVSNDIARLMTLMGQPRDLIVVDTVYPDDAPVPDGLNVLAEKDGGDDD